MAGPKKITSLPVTVEIDHRGAAITYTTRTPVLIQVNDFKKRYKGPKGMPAGVFAAAVIDLAKRKVIIATVNNPLLLTQGKPSL